VDGYSYIKKFEEMKEYLLGKKEKIFDGY